MGSLGCCQSESFVQSSDIPAWNIAVCGTACSGKKTIYHQLYFNQNAPDECIGGRIMFPIIWGIVQLCKIVITINDPYFETFQRKINKVSRNNHNYNLDDEYTSSMNAYIKVIAYYYDNFDIESYSQHLHPRAIDNLENLEINIWSIYYDKINDINKDMIEQFKILYYCKEMQYGYENYRHLYPLLENLPYFMNRLDVIVESAFKNGSDRADFEALIATEHDWTKMYMASSYARRERIDNPLTIIRKEKCKEKSMNNNNYNNVNYARVRYLRNDDSMVTFVTGRFARRNRWKYGFDSCQTVVYVAALDEYCKKSYVY